MRGEGRRETAREARPEAREGAEGPGTAEGAREKEERGANKSKTHLISSMFSRKEGLSLWRNFGSGKEALDILEIWTRRGEQVGGSEVGEEVMAVEGGR